MVGVMQQPVVELRDSPNTATPTLTVIDTARLTTMNGSAMTSMMWSAITSAAGSPDGSIARATNSSPQNRARVSPGRASGVDASSHGNQQVVADVVAVLVVDPLETVEVQEQHRRQLMGAARPRDGLLQQLLERSPT